MQNIARKFSRLIYRFLALSGIRAPVRLVMHLTRQNFVPAVVEVPRASRVVVLAPHMDDETIGCGGAICLHVAEGARVEVVFITDGSRGFEKDVIASHTLKALTDIRKKEAARACELLGVSRIHYLELPDAQSRPDADSVGKLLEVIGEIGPDLVYLPFVTDSHHDHSTTNKLFFGAIRKRAELGVIPCSCYEVWTPLHPNCIVDISAYMERKMSALACYESQLQMNNYLSSVRGLNAYRAIANQSEGYAEAFYLTTAADYLSLEQYL